MLPWSDIPTNKDFGVRFFLDTNLLIYLTDNTYQSLNDFIKILNESPFVELVSSQYVMFEFVGVRKREHYLRLAANNYSKLPNGKINFSSLIKYKDSYEIPNTNFEGLAAEIQKEVNDEVDKISRDFGIAYDFSSFHQDQLSPTFDVCLSSKISNQDSLVLVSSVLTQPKITHKNVVLLTNDNSFVTSYSKANIEQTLSNHSIAAPSIYSIDKINLKGTGHINLTIENTYDDLSVTTTRKILELITTRLESLYMGKTFTPSNLPDDVICFKLIENFSIKNNIYITVLGKNLDFIYTTRRKVEALQHNRTALNDGYTSPSDKKINVSYKLIDIDENGNEITPSLDIVNAIRQDGNLVFIHPDS